MVQRLYMIRVRGLMRSQLWAQILVAMLLAIGTLVGAALALLAFTVSALSST